MEENQLLHMVLQTSDDNGAISMATDPTPYPNENRVMQLKTP